jgi:hypothetical protein
MNGELLQMDHEEMREAYIRALKQSENLFNSFCNLCKTDYLPDTGEIIDVVTIDKIYRVWFCQPCLDKEKEYND